MRRGSFRSMWRRVLVRRAAWWPSYRDLDGIVVTPRPVTWADPSVRNRTGSNSEGRKFEPETVASMYAKASEHKIGLALGNNDPNAGSPPSSSSRRPSRSPRCVGSGASKSTSTCCAEPEVALFEPR
jgi:hypothetical protein